MIAGADILKMARVKAINMIRDAFDVHIKLPALFDDMLDGLMRGVQSCESTF